MSESLEERLSRLTPAATGLDRDALLFAAGRASVRPPRHWQVLTGLLAATQLATLALLWSRPVLPTSSAPAPVVEHSPVVLPEEPAPPLDPSELGVLRTSYLLSQKDDLPMPAPIENVAPDPPPLRAFGTAILMMPN
jgi:hypothetical protein